MTMSAVTWLAEHTSCGVEAAASSSNGEEERDAAGPLRSLPCVTTEDQFSWETPAEGSTFVEEPAWSIDSRGSVVRGTMGLGRMMSEPEATALPGMCP